MSYDKADEWLIEEAEISSLNEINWCQGVFDRLNSQ
jgi:hypothetical protein